LVSDDELVGVLALYSTEANAFNEEHGRIVEAVSRETSQTLKNAAEFDEISRRDALTDLTNLQQLEP
jgi:GAF domain-containing protein